MKLEIYPKPGVRTINDRLYSEETMLDAITQFNEKAKAIGVSYVETIELGEDVSLSFDVNMKNAVGSIKEVVFEDGCFHAEYKPLTNTKLPEEEIKTDDYVLLSKSNGVVVENNNVIVSKISGFYIIKRCELVPSETM